MGIDPADAVLVAAAFIIGLGNAALGSTGGLLLATIASVLPPPLAVPAHAVVEGARNGLGWVRLKRVFDTRIVMAAGLGALVAVGLVAPFTRVVPPHVQAILLGAFLFWACWWPVPDPGPRFAFRLPLMGGLTAAASVFLGETSPLMRPFIADEPVDPALVRGSVTAVAALQQGFKVVAFVVIGVDYLPILPVLIAMVVAMLLGMVVAERTKLRVPVGLASLTIRLAVTLLAARMVAIATGWL